MLLDSNSRRNCFILNIKSKIQVADFTFSIGGTCGAVTFVEKIYIKNNDDNIDEIKIRNGPPSFLTLLV